MSLSEELLRGICQPTPFLNTQFPFPVTQSFFGRDFHWDILEDQIEEIDETRVVDHLPLVLALAEGVEASQPDREEHFIPDKELRRRLVQLNQDTGWALVWGDGGGKMAQLLKLLRKERFQNYVVAPEEPPQPAGATYLGARPTSVIYYLQCLVRYAHIYGRIPLEQTDDVAHFLEEHGPGVILWLKEKPTALESALLLGLMFLGVPAVVPSSYSSPYGNVRRADTSEDMVKEALQFSNLRVRAGVHLRLDLPFNCDPIYNSEQVETGNVAGGTALSSFVVTHEGDGDGVEVVGKLGPDMAIELACADPGLDITATEFLELFARRFLNYIDGASFQVSNGVPMLTWRPELPLKAEHVAQVLYHWFKAEFHVQGLKVRVVFERELAREMKARAEDYRRRREQALAAVTEEAEPYFYGCIRCRSFALEHACTVTPERPPQCGKPWTEIKSHALFSEHVLAPHQTDPGTQNYIVDKGCLLDAVKGEYQGVNSAARQRSGGHVERVFLHSIMGHPHTACSCFRALAFYIPEVDGIGLIDREFAGRVPIGQNWDALANAAAGKQTSGIAAMGLRYMKSPKFLQGDGGWRKVVWMPRALKQSYAADKDWIATEKEATTLEDLKAFTDRFKQASSARQ